MLETPNTPSRQRRGSFSLSITGPDMVLAAFAIGFVAVILFALWALPQ